MNGKIAWQNNPNKVKNRDVCQDKNISLLEKKEKTVDSHIPADTSDNPAPEVENKPVQTSGFNEYILTEEKSKKEEVWPFESTICLRGDKAMISFKGTQVRDEFQHWRHKLTR